MGQSRASAGLPAHGSGGVQNCPVARPDTFLRRVMSLRLRGEQQTESKTLLSAPLSDQRHQLGERSCRTAGCERGFMPAQVATRLQEARDHSTANTVRAAAKERASASVRVQTARLRSGSCDCVAVKLLSTQIVRKQAKAISSRTTRHIACNVAFNAFQHYEGLARLATAKLERRCSILELAHPPLYGNGANSLGIHESRLLKLSASRQEKASACNRNCAAADQHFCHAVVFDRCVDVYAAGT